MRVSLVVIALLYFVVVSASAVSANTDRDYDTLCTQAYDCAFFDLSEAAEQVCGSDVGTISSSASLKERKAYIYSVLVNDFKLKPFQAAGVMGNMAHESGFEPMRLQGTPSGTETPAEKVDMGTSLGWGLVQWTPASKIIKNYDPKSKVNDLGVQLKFLKKQLDESENAAWKALIATSNVEDAAKVFMTKYERPADQSTQAQNGRAATAKTIFIELGSSANISDTTSSATVCDEDGSGTIVGEFSLPVEQKHYDSNREWFTKPHHDYPAADIPVASGAKLFAVANGKITGMAQSGDNGGQGTFVKITSGDVVFTYMHGTPGSIKVKDGFEVKAGQLLMLSDNTGHSTGPHLHFQIDIKGSKHCPQKFFDAVGQGKAPPKFNELPTSGCTN